MTNLKIESRFNDFKAKRLEKKKQKKIYKNKISKAEIIKEVILDPSELYYYYSSFKELCVAYYSSIVFLNENDVRYLEKIYTNRNQRDNLIAIAFNMKTADIHEKLISSFETNIKGNTDNHGFLVICENSSAPIFSLSSYENFLNKLSKFINENELENFTQFYIKFHEKFKKIAESRNMDDKFRYHKCFTKAELFNMLAVTLLEFSSVALTIAFPPYAAVTGTITAFAIISAINGGRRVLTPFASRAYFIVRKDVYYGKSFQSPTELYEPLNSNNGLSQNSNGFLINSFSKNKYEIELNNLNKMNKVLSEISNVATRNGLVNFNLSSLFHYYINLVEKFDHDLSQTDFKKSIFHKGEPYEKEFQELENIYYKTMNYSRYMKALKTPLYAQLGSIRLSLLKSIQVLFSPESTFSVFCNNHIVNSSKSNKEYYRTTIENKIKKKYKSINGFDRSVYTDLIFSTIVSGKLSPDKSKEFLQGLDNLVNKKDYGQEMKNWFKDLSHPTSLGRKGVGILGNLGWIFYGTSETASNPLKQFNSDSKYYFQIGGAILYNLVLGITYVANDRKPSKKLEFVTDIMKYTMSTIYMGECIIGLVNYIGVWSGKLVNTTLSNFAASPFGLIADVGISYASHKIDQHEKKMWNKIVEDYVEYRETEMELRNKPESETNLFNGISPNAPRKYWRPAFDFFKKQDKNAVNYMKNISKIYSDKLGNISQLAIEVNKDIISLVKKVEKFNEQKTNYVFKTSFKEKYFKKVDYSEDKIIEDYTKLFTKIIALSGEIESYDYYLNNFVDGFLTEVDYSLQLYMSLLIDNIKDPKLHELSKFGEIEKIANVVFERKFYEVTEL
ncbi:hypothetical protein GCL60_09575 [Silvanigrella paludirubra]|uniref:Uncharacterized protein n=1 Tax=Silvanigrella paludirubra TaxID=2499159 RepID=A0A6N6VV48_9BACT|nr:hypothetical protein [Silvanigrella paludirubra]KAB8039094.1 hypothetical protein GCL60_09575 [Silvanigrella paludirubra]